MIIKTVFVIIISAVLSMLLRTYKPELCVPLSIASGIIIWYVLNPTINDSVAALRTILSYDGINSTYASIILKSLGICILTQLTVGICKDANESALASKAEIAGKIVIFSVSIPMLTSIAQIAIDLID